MNPYIKEYNQLQMQLAHVRSEMKNCNFLGHEWQRLDKEESAILKLMRS